MKLYYNPMSPNSRKVRVLLEHTGTNCESQIIDFTKGEHKAPEFLAINPNGMLPTLVDGELRLWESNAIVWHLARKLAPELLGTSAAESDVLRWLLWQNAHFDPPCAALTFENVLKQAFGIGAADPEVVQQAEAKFCKFASVLEEELGRHSYVVGDALTVADFALASSLMYAEPASIPVQDFKNVSAWRNRVTALNAWRVTEQQRG